MKLPYPDPSDGARNTTELSSAAKVFSDAAQQHLLQASYNAGADMACSAEMQPYFAPVVEKLAGLDEAKLIEFADGMSGKVHYTARKINNGGHWNVEELTELSARPIRNLHDASSYGYVVLNKLIVDHPDFKRSLQQADMITEELAQFAKGIAEILVALVKEKAVAASAVQDVNVATVDGATPLAATAANARPGGRWRLDPERNPTGFIEGSLSRAKRDGVEPPARGPSYRLGRF